MMMEVEVELRERQADYSQGEGDGIGWTSMTFMKAIEHDNFQMSLKLIWQ